MSSKNIKKHTNVNECTISESDIGFKNRKTCSNTCHKNF